VALERERIKKLSEIAPAVEYFFTEPAPEKGKLSWKNQPAAEAAARLTEVGELLSDLPPDDFTAPILETKIKKMIEEKGGKNGETLWPLRVALSGREASPGPFDIMTVLGKEKTLRRIDAAIALLR